MISIYTDGSCLKNPGAGGWAYIALCDNDREVKKRGGCKNTTNNRMELVAVIKAVSAYRNEYKTITIYSDSLLTINCAQKIWRRKKNLDLWEVYDDVSRDCNIIFKKVKAHDGNRYNEMVDKLAKKSAEKISCVE